MILRRVDERFSEVVPRWAGGTFVVVGGGPSLSLEQIEKVRTAHQAGKVRCIAVNDAYLWADFADVLYAADARWWSWQATGIPKPLLKLDGAEVVRRYKSFAGERCTIQHGDWQQPDGVHMLRNMAYPLTHSVGLSLDPKKLVTGRNGGFQAVNLAVLAGGRRGILLGFDGKPGHFGGGYPSPTQDAFYDLMRKSFSAAEHLLKDAGVEVLNCSPGTAIDSFPKIAIDEALA